MRRSFIVLVVATAVLFASSAAGLAVKLAADDDTSEVAATGPDTAARKPAAPAETPAAGDDKVTVIEVGAEPRRPLRLKPVAGTTVRTALTARVAIDQTVDGERLDTPAVPGFTMVMVQHVDSVDAAGSAQVTLTYTDVKAAQGPDSDPAVVEAVNTALGDLEGLSGTAVVDARGEVQESTLDTDGVEDPVAKSMLDSLDSQLRNLSAPFPREPIGVGARWTARTKATLVGITAETTTTYTLTEWDGDHYELAVVAKVTAPSGPVELPGLPAGTDAAISRFEVRTTGTVGGDVMGALPTSASSAAEGDMAFRITEDGRTGRLEQHLEMEFEFSPAR